MSVPVAYHCKTCGQISPRTQLTSGSWGDKCCPACGSPDLERFRSRFERWYAIFFLYKVY